MRETDQSDLPEFCQKPTLVLGCGNLLFGDDGFGCALVAYVQSHHRVPENACLLDVGTGVRKLLFTLCLSPVRPQRLLVVDALDAGHPPGELFEIDPADIPVVKLDDFSLHQLPTSNLLRELQETSGVEVRVLACQTGPLPQEVRPGLSPPLEAALPRAAEWLVREYLPASAHHARIPPGDYPIEADRAMARDPRSAVAPRSQIPGRGQEC
jgi:coenzyme F420 hydrogenase subunit delta